MSSNDNHNSMLITLSITIFVDKKLISKSLLGETCTDDIDYNDEGEDPANGSDVDVGDEIGNVC